MDISLNTSKYNYKHFKSSDYDFKDFKGPKAGDKYIDFEATTIEGNTVSLSNYLDKPIILDTGSITCPMYANTQSPMNLLQEQYPEYHFLLLYVREAHPGGKTTEIKSIEQKTCNAKSMQTIYNEKRTVLIDSIDGNAHKLYGTMPNMTYVIGKDGIVKFRANWTNINALKKVLKDMDTIEAQDYYEAVKPPLSVAIRTLMLGGVRALYEFVINLPGLIRQHKEVQSKEIKH